MSNDLTLSPSATLIIIFLLAGLMVGNVFPLTEFTKLLLMNN